MIKILATPKPLWGFPATDFSTATSRVRIECAPNGFLLSVRHIWQTNMMYGFEDDGYRLFSSIAGTSIFAERDYWESIECVESNKHLNRFFFPVTIEGDHMLAGYTGNRNIRMTRDEAIALSTVDGILELSATGEVTDESIKRALKFMRL